MHIFSVAAAWSAHPQRLHFFRLLAFAAVLALILEAAIFQFHTFAIDVGSTATDAFLVNFRDPERETAEQGGYSFQWTRASSTLLLPGFDGRWEAEIRFRQRPEDPPTAVAFRAHNLDLTVNPAPGMHRYRIPLDSVDSLQIESAVSKKPGSETGELGIAVDTVVLTRKQAAPTLHPLVWLFAGLLTLALGWVRATAKLPRRDAGLLFGGSALTALLVAAAYTPYFLLLVPIVSIVLTCTVPITLGLNWLLVRHAAWLSGVPVAVFTCLIVIKLAGTLFPAYLPTDTLFHANRFTATMAGNFYTTAFGQGQTYPYPPGTYLLVAPLSLVFGDLRWLLPVCSIVIDASSVFVLAFMLRSYGERVVGWACLLYAVMPVAVLVHWQGGFTQSVGQWFGLLLIAALVEQASSLHPVRRSVWLLLALGLFATVGHFGVVLNLGLMSVVLFALLAMRRKGVVYAFVLPVAAVVMLMFYYSAFGQLFIAQLGNLTASSADQGGSRLFLLRRFVWELGIRDHYQGVYLALALLPLVALMPHNPRTAILRRVCGAMLLTSAVLMVLQIAILFNPTRYLVFMYPAVAALAGFTLSALARQQWGWALTRALVCFSVFTSLSIWAAGVALDQRIGFLL